MMEQIMEHFLAEMNVMQERTDANLERMEAKIGAIKENSEVLRGTLVFRMDTHEARTEVKQNEMIAKVPGEKRRRPV
jgi:hypothetical protein